MIRKYSVPTADICICILYTDRYSVIFNQRTIVLIVEDVIIYNAWDRCGRTSRKSIIITRRVCGPIGLNSCSNLNSFNKTIQTCLVLVVVTCGSKYGWRRAWKLSVPFITCTSKRNKRSPYVQK